MTEEMTRAGIEAEARRRYREAAERGKRAAEFARCVLYTVGILGGVALLMMFAHMKRAERDSRAAMDYARYELIAVTGGAK